jgi:hypothetical protein
VTAPPRNRAWARATILGLLTSAVPAWAQFTSLETKELRLVYLDPTQSYLAPHVGRCFYNSLAFHRKLFEYTPSEKVTVLLTDFADFGNAGASSVPRDAVTLKIAPLSFAFETFTANERMNYLMNHELAHVANMDQTAGRDVFFRRLFFGKVVPISPHPESIPYFYLTSPRVAVPRWYLEGMAVFFDTWMAGGLGRAQGPYDEMVFRSLVLDGARFYDPLGLASELTKVDFRQESGSYLYGTRFMSYLAYRYSPESLVRWVSRKGGSKAYYASEFERVYGLPLAKAWRDWIAFEHEFQEKNLGAIRQYPTTPFTDISHQALGSLSRAYLDPKTQTLYAGLNYPGIVAHVAAISPKDGSIEKIHDIKEPRIYTVTSLAYDPDANTLFYTADNTAYRDLMLLDPKTKRERMLLKDARIGDLVFDRADRSIWGVRAFNGICTLVRIPYPYKEWNKLYSWPYGEIAYDLDLSPDGRLLSASVGQINGRQTLRVMKTESLLSGDPTPTAEFDFGTAIPSNFVFSPDGRYLYGSSYYTGVSNIFRFDLATGVRQALTNAETGFFRPIPLGGDSLIVFRYTGEGFVPTRIEAQPLEDISPITFLGQQLVEKYPVLKDWVAGSPAAVPIESMVMHKGPYSPFRSLGLESIYPVVEGYKDFAAYGLHLRLSDPVQLNGASFTASYTPSSDLPENERLHLEAEYRRYEWRATVRYNYADFYDLFGPTQMSLKGYSAGLGYLKTLVYDVPRQLDLAVEATYYGGLDRLPDFQNVPTDFSSEIATRARLRYSNVRRSLGGVDDEKGLKWEAAFAGDRVTGQYFPKFLGDLDLGFALPLKHSSIWLRSSAGYSPGAADQPFANFYFGGFGNNWVDHLEVKRYREWYAFPGVGLDAIGGTNYVKSMLEWNLPPIRFRHAGSPGFYLTWARPAVFVSGISTNLGDPAARTVLANAGAQLDFRLSMLSQLDLTLSLGYARAFEDGVRPRNEYMVSLNLLR